MYNKQTNLMHSAKNHNDKQLSLIDGSKSSYTNKKYDFGNRFSFIDLFAGIGGFRLALEALDMDCLFSSEWDLNAKKTYQKNFSELPHGDINDVKKLSLHLYENPNNMQRPIFFNDNSYTICRPPESINQLI